MRQRVCLLSATLLMAGCSGPGWRSTLTSPVSAPLTLTLDQPLPRLADTLVVAEAPGCHTFGGCPTPTVPAYTRGLPSGVLQLRAFLSTEGLVRAFEVLDADTTALTSRRAYYERRLGAPQYTDSTGLAAFWVSPQTYVLIRTVSDASQPRVLTTVAHRTFYFFDGGPEVRVTPRLWRICNDDSRIYCERRRPLTQP